MGRKIIKSYEVVSAGMKRRQGAFPRTPEGKKLAENYSKSLSKKTGDKYIII